MLEGRKEKTGIAKEGIGGETGIRSGSISFLRIRDRKMNDKWTMERNRSIKFRRILTVAFDRLCKCLVFLKIKLVNSKFLEKFQ